MLRRSIAALLLCACYATPLWAAPTYMESIYGVSVTKDLTYGTGATNNGNSSTSLKLDIYRPTDIGNGPIPASTPAIVMIHGGGFTGGNKNDLAPAAEVFASFGYVVASINYRLSSSNPPLEPGPGASLTSPPPPYATLSLPQGIRTINAAVNDATKAMQWMNANAALFGVDPNRIGIGGASAGAVTALLQAYNNPPADAAPKVVLSYLGSMYNSEDSIQPGAAPAFIVAGANDNVVPASGSVDVAARLDEVGVYNQLFVQPGVGHTVDYLKFYGGKPLIQHNLEFLVNHLVNPLVVPEPSSWLLASFGVLALAGAARRRKLRQQRS